MTKRQRNKRQFTVSDGRLNPLNLAENVKEDELEAIAAAVVDDYEDDKNSLAEFIEKRKKWLELYVGHRKPKDTPWKNASNVHVPFIGTAAIQFHARAYGAILPAKGIVKAESTDGSSINSAKRVAKYMNWQVTKQMKEFIPGMDNALIELPVSGTAIKKTYYDPLLGRPVSEFLPTDEVVVSYHCKSMAACQRITHVIDEFPNEIRKRQRRGIYLDDGEELGSGAQFSDNEFGPSYGALVDDIDGKSEATTTEHPRAILEQHRNWDLDGDGIGEPYIVTVDAETSKVLRIVSRTDDETGEEIGYFTFYNFLPNPNSLYGIGFGHLMAHINEAANTNINQLTDSGHLQNIQSGAINSRGKGLKGTLQMAMGRFIKVDASGDDIRKSLFQFQFHPPSQTLFNLLGLLQDYSERISSVSDAMMGQLPPSDTTATTMLAIMEQGQKVFSTVHQRIHREFTKELQLIAYWNSKFLDPDEYATVMDSNSVEGLEYIKTMALQKTVDAQTDQNVEKVDPRGDFKDTINVMPTSDPNITSRAEQLTKAKEAYNLIINEPLTANNQESRTAAFKNVLYALEIDNVEVLVPPPPPPPAPQDLPPVEENANFIREVQAVALPDQDHEAHFEGHNTFSDSKFGQELTPQGRNLLDAHILDTKALLYKSQSLENQERTINRAVEEAMIETRGENGA